MNTLGTGKGYHGSSLAFGEGLFGVPMAGRAVGITVKGFDAGYCA